MKVTRSIKLHFSRWLTSAKKKNIAEFFEVCHGGMCNMLSPVENQIRQGKSCFDMLKKNAIVAPTAGISARLRQNLIQNLYAQVNGHLKLSATLNKQYKTPRIKKGSLFLSSSVSRIVTSPELVDFDLLVELHSTGMPKLAIPLKRNRLLNAYLKTQGAKLCTSILMTTSYVQVTVEFDVSKRSTGGVIGVDPGAINLIATDAGTMYGTCIPSLLRKLRRKKRYSTAWYRCKKEISSYVAHTVKQLPLQDISLLVLEDNRGIRHNRKQRGRLCRNIRSFLDGWTAGELSRRIEYATQSNGVSLRRVSAWNNSIHCPACGRIGKDNRLNQSTFKCAGCGHSAHADSVGALNVLARFSLGKYGSEYKELFMKKHPSYVLGNAFL